jgi:hypothetical protein
MFLDAVVARCQTQDRRKQETEGKLDGRGLMAPAHQPTSCLSISSHAFSTASDKSALGTESPTLGFAMNKFDNDARPIATETGLRTLLLKQNHCHSFQRPLRDQWPWSGFAAFLLVSMVRLDVVCMAIFDDGSELREHRLQPRRGIGL